MNTSKPLVSIICFSKDRAGSVRRCVESVLAQTYTNFEFVIQDGASTDGTLEILRSYNDPRIKLVSEPDSGPAEAFWKVLQRCEGDIVSSCLSDEELLPHAIQEAVDLFGRFPDTGAFTRDGYVTDTAGKVTSEFIAGEFDFVDYLFGRYCPMFCASFFRRQALLEVGLKDEQWNQGCIEFEIWCRLGTRHSVKYIPGFVAKYGVDEKQQLSNTPKNFNEHLDSRTNVIEHLFSQHGFFGEDKVKKAGCLYNQHYLFYNHARAYKLHDSMDQIYRRMMAIEKSIDAEETSEYLRSFSGSSASRVQQRARLYGRASRLWLRCSARCPRFIKRSLSLKQKLAIRKAVLNAVTNLLALIPRPIPTAAENGEGQSADAMYGLGDPEYSRNVYHDVAMLYYGRGAIDYALFLWRKAEELGDVNIDSVAVQAALLSPSATNESLLAGQRRWAERHAKPLDRIGSLSPKPFDGHRKIRIGYYCSFFDGDVVRAMFAPVVQHRDRERFTAIAYSVTPAARHMEGSFDEFKVTGMMPDRDFVKRVRDDEIDIFVEMSGFSPFNRYAAMASRCAPIQIAHFNHSGTCGVRNVDYAFADAMSVTPEDERYYSEKVWRLDGDFLFFNYEWAKLPEPRDPPCLKNGYVTFGCFGSAGKLSDPTIEMWAAILHQVPNSRIYIRNGPLGLKVNRDFLAQRFARYGIPSSRLRLEGATDWKLFIGSYADVDISFDTWPYCGANTIGESVWQGVPVITLKGDRFSSRYGSSHVAAAGTPELIAHTPDLYIALAAELGAQPEKILYYRRNLRRMAKEHGLSDPSRFARKLEKAYLEMMYLLHERATDRRAGAGVTASAI